MALGQNALPPHLIPKTAYREQMTLPYADSDAVLEVFSSDRSIVDAEASGHSYVSIRFKHPHDSERSFGLHSREAYDNFMASMRDAGKAIGWKQPEMGRGLFGDVVLS